MQRYEDASAKGDITAQLKELSQIKFHGGGAANHAFFWKALIPTKEYKEPEGDILQLINRDFGGHDQLKQQMIAASAAHQGSGWCWLTYDPRTGTSSIVCTDNQNNLSSSGYAHLYALTGIDLWCETFFYVNLRSFSSSCHVS